MQTHTITGFLRWCSEEKKPLLWSAFLALCALFISMHETEYRAQLTTPKEYAVAITRVAETMTGQKRRILARAARIRRRLAARVKSKDVVIGTIDAVTRTAVYSLDTVTQAPVLRSGPGDEPSVHADVRCAPFIGAVHPVTRVPDWGSMHSPQEWNQDYAHMPANSYVPVPRYDLQQLTIPMKSLTQPFLQKNEPVITAKLYYSTRYFGSYDVDAHEFTGAHPGVDLKLAEGTPVGAIAGGVVDSVNADARLGLHVIIRHCASDGVYYSVYGHFDSASVRAGDTVIPGQIIGRVGMTGMTSGPHIHLQVDREVPGEASPHKPYHAMRVPSPSEADQFVVNPMWFIENH